MGFQPKEEIIGPPPRQTPPLNRRDGRTEMGTRPKTKLIGPPPRPTPPLKSRDVKTAPSWRCAYCGGYPKIGLSSCQHCGAPVPPYDDDDYDDDPEVTELVGDHRTIAVRRDPQPLDPKLIGTEWR